MTRVRIRWDDDRSISETWPFPGVIVEDLDGQRISDIPVVHTPSVVHAPVGETITIEHFVVPHSLNPATGEVRRKSLTLLVMANEIPERRREEIKQAWIQFMTESNGELKI